MPITDGRRSNTTEAPLGGCPDAERLAEYIDGVLDDADRARIEAHLTTCADCRTVVSETTVVLDQEGTRRAAKVSRVVPFRSKRWVTRTAAGLAAAAVIALAVYVEHAQRSVSPPTPPVASQRSPDAATTAQIINRAQAQQELVAAFSGEQTRPVQGRLAGGFKYAPAPVVMRGPDQQRQSLAIRAAARDVIDSQNAQARNDLVGVAYLLVGETDKAIESLSIAAPLASARMGIDRTEAAQLQGSYVHTDLAAAYIERAKRDGSRSDYEKAVAAAREALRLRPALLEPRFNLALALEGLERIPEAREEWTRYLSGDSSSEWANEAREHLRSLPPEPAK